MRIFSPIKHYLNSRSKNERIENNYGYQLAIEYESDGALGVINKLSVDDYVRDIGKHEAHSEIAELVRREDEFKALPLIVTIEESERAELTTTIRDCLSEHGILKGKGQQFGEIKLKVGDHIHWMEPNRSHWGRVKHISGNTIGLEYWNGSVLEVDATEKPIQYSYVRLSDELRDHTERYVVFSNHDYILSEKSKEERIAIVENIADTMMRSTESVGSNLYTDETDIIYQTAMESPALKTPNSQTPNQLPVKNDEQTMLNVEHETESLEPVAEVEAENESGI